MENTIENCYLLGISSFMHFVAEEKGVSTITKDFLLEKKQGLLDNYYHLDMFLCGFCVSRGFSIDDYTNIEEPFEYMYDKLIDLCKEN